MINSLNCLLFEHTTLYGCEMSNINLTATLNLVPDGTADVTPRSVCNKVDFSQSLCACALRRLLISYCG